MYKYHNTIRKGAETQIEGLENIEMFLDEKDVWNFHDSNVESFEWDNTTHILHVTIDAEGYEPNIPEDRRSMKALLDFHFQQVVDFKIDVAVGNDSIQELSIEKTGDYLDCWLDAYLMNVLCKRIKVDPPRFVNRNYEFKMISK